MGHDSTQGDRGGHRVRCAAGRGKGAADLRRVPQGHALLGPDRACPLVGRGVWIPLGDTDFGVGYENHTSFPSAGQIILYPGGISETEILLAYGGISFASKMGQLAGNHFITLTSNLDRLMELGNSVLWKGAHDIRFEFA
jgi:hypothetical protein